MAVPAVESPRGPWLLGSVPDLLFGCGIAWMLVFALRSVAGAQVASWVSAAPLLILFSIPHYGATLIQAYESPEIRRKHVVISVYTSIFLSVAFAACLYSTLLGSVVLTIYLSWSPWHYSGQNYGIFLTLLGRRNIRPDERLKKWIHGSFVFSFVLTFLSLHGAAAAYAPVTYAGTVYQLLSIDVPYAIATVVVTIASAGYVLCLAQTFLGLKRHGSLLSMWPCFLILALQAMWFAVPVVIRQLGDQYGLTDSTGLYSAYGFQWIAAAHAVQYLWFCTYYTIRSTGERSILTYLGKCYLGGAAIWILPGVLFGPSLLGRISFDSGLALMVAAFVNLHHFVLDGAIWKLKDSGVSRVLFRAEASNEMTTPAEEDSTSRRRFRWGLAVFGGIAIACTALNFFESNVGFERALERGKLDRARIALDRIAWVGTDSSEKRARLGRRFAGRRDRSSAREQFEKSVELHPTVLAWLAIGQLDELAEELDSANRAYEAALQVDPNHVPALIRAGSLLLKLEEPEHALLLLERAADIAPRNPRLKRPLARARRDAMSRDP